MLIKYIEEFINSMIRSLAGNCLIFGIKVCILLKKLSLIIEVLVPEFDKYHL